MEREKMIEEIVSIMGEWAIENRMCWNSKHAESLVKYLMGKNVLKIPEDALIITREELVKAVESGYVYDTTSGDKINIIEMAREIEREETAREILNKLLNLCYDDNHPRGSVAAGELRYIAKMDFGVEV